MGKETALVTVMASMCLLISEYYLAPARLRLARISNVKICKYGFA